MDIRRRPTINGTKNNVRGNAVDPSSPGRSAPASTMLVKSSCVDIVLAGGRWGGGDLVLFSLLLQFVIMKVYF